MYMQQRQEGCNVQRYRKSDGRNRQTIGGRGPKSLSRRDVSGACKLSKVQPLRSIIIQRPIRPKIYYTCFPITSP